MTDPVVLQLVGADSRLAIMNVVGFAVLAGLLALAAAFLYRERTTRGLPLGTAIVFGVGIVATWLNLQAIIGDELVGGFDPVGAGTSYYLLGVFLAAVLVAELGRQLGDYLASDVFDIERIAASNEVASLVKSAGVVVPVRLPDEIVDLAGYPPVENAPKERFAGRTLALPSNLSRAEMADRLERRLEEDYGVAQAAVELSESYQVESVAVGRNPAGIGPTIPPDTLAIALRADPPPTASAGDPVELWTRPAEDEQSRLVGRGTFRSRRGDVATLLVPAGDAFEYDLGDRYRLTTVSESPTDVNEFIAALRMAEETITRLDVRKGGPFEGEFVSWLPLSVLVLERDGEVVPFPPDNDTLQAGDVVYAMGTPSDLDTLDGYREQRLAARDATGTARTTT